MLQTTLKKFICVLVFLWAHILIPSILTNTLIKTPTGHTKVENITIGDSLIGYNNKQCVKTSITNISISTTTAITVIATNKGDIYAAPNQLFYDPIAAQWIAAKKITTDTVLLDSKNNHYACLDIKTISVEPTKVYYISTTSPHTFFVYNQELLTHNNPPILIGLAWLFGGGLEFLGATISTAIFGSVLGIEFYKKHQNNNAKFAISTQMVGSYGGYNPDPNDDNNKERKFNTISKAEFFKKVKNEYEHYRDGIYRRKRGTTGINDAEYLEWDHLHNDVEAYCKSKRHIGSIDPKTLKLYKPAVRNRQFPFK